MKPQSLRVLVAEDEPVARRGLVRQLAAMEGLEVAGEVSDGRQALDALSSGAWDIAVLDIEMPELSGLEVVEQLGPERMPVVIFVTAFDHYACQAFDAFALDYVLKPVDPERLALALERARAACRGEREGGRLGALLDDLHPARRHPERITARLAGRTQIVPVEAIDWIEAADNYVRLHLAERIVLMREPLAHLLNRLDPERFVRVHRSHAVQIDRVVELRSGSRGDGELVLANGKVLAVSRRFRGRMEDALEN